MNKDGKMKNAPVYYALVQANFNPIAAMNKYINDIQDEFRKASYTLFEQQVRTQFQFSNSLGEIEPKVAQTSSCSWVISKQDRKSGFILTESSVMFHTTHYETHKEFIAELLRGLKIVHDIVKLAHLSRVGLRYLNAVLPAPGEKLNQYLVSGLHGVNFKAEKNYSLSESLFKTECGPKLTVGKLIIRVLQFKSPLGYPPGISPYGLMPMKRFDIREILSHAIIDIDHFVEDHMTLDFNEISEQLFSLYRVTKQAFKATITSYAQKKWC